MSSHYKDPAVYQTELAARVRQNDELLRYMQPTKAQRYQLIVNAIEIARFANAIALSVLTMEYCQ